MIRYSLQRYSLPCKIEYSMSIRAYFTENMQALLGVGSDTALENHFSETVKNSAIITASLPLVVFYEQNILQKSELLANSIIYTSFAEKLLATVAFVKNTYITQAFAQYMGSSIYLGKNMPLTAIFEEDTLAKVFLGCNLFIKDDMGEIIHCIISGLYTFEMDELLIDTVIPPGGELRIDSENYTITLGGKNIIHLTKGQWQFLTRDTVKLGIDSATGGKLSTKILYNERFL